MKLVELLCDNCGDVMGYNSETDDLNCTHIYCPTCAASGQPLGDDK